MHAMQCAAHALRDFPAKQCTRVPVPARKCEQKAHKYIYIRGHIKTCALPAATPCSMKLKAVSKWSLSFSSALSSTEMQLYLQCRGSRQGRGSDLRVVKRTCRRCQSLIRNEQDALVSWFWREINGGGGEGRHVTRSLYGCGRPAPTLRTRVMPLP
jgi:hypothetical protein